MALYFAATSKEHILRSCLKRTSSAIYLRGKYLSGCLVHYYIEVGVDGRRLGGPVDWKTLAPGRESACGSISAGANVAAASLELWCKGTHCVTPRVWERKPLKAVKQSEDRPHLKRQIPPFGLDIVADQSSGSSDKALAGQEEMLSGWTTMCRSPAATTGAFDRLAINERGREGEMG